MTIQKFFYFFVFFGGGGGGGGGRGEPGYSEFGWGGRGRTKKKSSELGREGPRYSGGILIPSRHHHF